jgi:hypothetical protein
MDKAGEILGTLSSPEELEADGENTPAETQAFVTRLNKELADIALKLKVPSVTEQMVYDFDDAWNKQTVANLKVYVRKIVAQVAIMTMDFYVATVDGKTWEVFNFEDDYPFADNEIAQLDLTADKKNSEVYFRDIFFRIYQKNVSQDATINAFLNGIREQDVTEGNGIIQAI